MAFTHGKKATFKLATFANPVAAGLVDLSAFLVEVQFPQTADVAEISTFGASDKTYLVGLRDKTFSITGIFDPTPDAQLNAIWGIDDRLFAWEYRPAGGASPIYSQAGAAAGNQGAAGAVGAILTNYQPTSPIGDRVGFTASFQVSGLVTRA